MTKRWFQDDDNTHDTIDNMWARGTPIGAGGEEVRTQGDFIRCPDLACDGLIKFDAVRIEPGMALNQSGVFIDAHCSECNFAGQLGVLNQQVRDDEFFGRLVWVYKVRKE